MNLLQQKMIQAINTHGALLVFPIKNKAFPLSLWSVLYPRSKMVWEWNEDSDSRISKLWIDREEISKSEEVVYTKWYQGRATFFSKEVFLHLLAYLQSPQQQEFLPSTSQQALREFLDESPLSTKRLKALLEWQGRLLEGHYNRAMKPLWQQLYIVGFGEENDSSFPSLNMAATSSLFEDLWLASKEIEPKEAYLFLQKKLGEDSLFLKFANKLKQRKS